MMLKLPLLSTTAYDKLKISNGAWQNGHQK